jgi:hypothetical protein
MMMLALCERRSYHVSSRHHAQRASSRVLAQHVVQHARKDDTHIEGLSTPLRIPEMLELEGYWQLKSLELLAFGGNPVFEMRADGTGVMPGRYGKFKSWRIKEQDEDYYLEIKLLDSLSAPVTLSGRLMLSEYFPLVVERGKVLRVPRSGGEQTPIGDFELTKVG